MTFKPARVVHPGEILKELFMEPLDMTYYALAKATGLQPIHISDICKGKRAVTARTAILFARYFGVDPEFWMNLQRDWDLALATQDAEKNKFYGVKPRELIS